MRTACCLVACLMLSATDHAGASEHPNVLFIAIDDLNHWVGHLGRNPQAKTPHLDRLAGQGVTFTAANCAAPSCNPSRAALMSGMRPSTTGVYHNGQDWMPVIGKAKTLTTQFLRAGYNVYGAGKIYHASAHRKGEWTEYHASKRDPERLHASAKNAGVGGIKFAPLANSDEEMNDYKVVSYGISKLESEQEKPFFLAIGIYRPHMPWNVPRKYFDLFPLESIELPPHRQDDLADIPESGVRLAKPSGDHAKMLASGRWKEAVQAYLASVAFADAQLGRLVDALDRSAYRDNTVVVLWSDHGWHLGEKEHWRKFALWEEACRSILVWRAPGVSKPGGVCYRPVDHMSIYPTLCDLAGVAVPSHVEGHNIRALLEDPTSEWDTPAVTTFGRGNHSVRGERYRYILYADGGEELYDHAHDPYEWTNLAGDPALVPVRSRLERFVPERDAAERPWNKQRRQRRAVRGAG